MAQQIHPDESLIPLMRRVVAGNVVYHLYTNDLTPDKDTVLADFDEVGSGPGYVPIEVDEADFVLEGVSGHAGLLIALPIEFMVVGAVGDVYGFFATNVAGDELLACGRFDGAPLNLDVGSRVTVWPMFGDTSKFP